MLFNKDKTVILKFPSGGYIYAYNMPDTVVEINQRAFENCFCLRSLALKLQEIRNIFLLSSLLPTEIKQDLLNIEAEKELLYISGIPLNCSRFLS